MSDDAEITEARWRSNYGAGPLEARFISEDVDRGIVTLARWDTRFSRREVFFTLPTSFLSSPACGWRRILEGGE